MWYGRTNKVDFETQIATKCRFAALLRQMQARDTGFTPLAAQRLQRKNDLVVLQEAYEHATDDERGRIRKAIKIAAARQKSSRANQARAKGKRPRRARAREEFPSGVDPLAHHEIGVTERRTLRIPDWIAANDGDPALSVLPYHVQFERC